MAVYAALENRGVLAVGGDDRVGFLQGLLTNDVRRVGPAQTLYALLLTPQGKFLHDLFVADGGDALWLDGEAERLGDLQRRLAIYRLRAKVTLTDRRDALCVFAVFGADAAARLGLGGERGAAGVFGGGLACVDPRAAELGGRVILPREGAEAALAAAGIAAGAPEDYDRLRLSLGVPDGSRDLAVEKALPIESNLDSFHAISFDKGCYVGQELTARTRYRAPIRKRLMPVTVDGPMPEPGTPVLLGETEAGRLFSGRDGVALALLRLEALERARNEALALTAASAVVVPRSWPEPAA
jgi:tRNA-modifying protein YgfZ